MIKGITIHKTAIFILVFLVLIVPAFAQNTTCVCECKQEEIISRVNTFTQATVSETMDNRFNAWWDKHYPEVDKKVMDLKGTFEIGVKLLAISLFGAVFMALVCYKILVFLIDKRRRKYGN